MELTISLSGAIHFAKVTDTKLKTYKDLWKVISLLKQNTNILPMARPRFKEEKLSDRRSIYTQTARYILKDRTHYRTALSELTAVLTKWRWKSKAKGRDRLWMHPKDGRVSLTVSSPVFVGGGVRLTLVSSWIDPIKEPENGANDVRSKIIYNTITDGGDYEMRKATKLEKERAARTVEKPDHRLARRKLRGSKPAKLMRSDPEGNVQQRTPDQAKEQEQAQQAKPASKPEARKEPRREPKKISAKKPLPADFDQLDFEAQIDALLS